MLSKLNFRILRIIDEKVLVNILNYQKYYSIHKFLGFPLKKLDFYYTHGYELDLKNPKTFNERIVYRQLFETNPLLATLVDKYAVREYVKEKIGEKYLIPLLQVADSYEEIDFSSLPHEFILKSTHGSGENIIFKNGKNNCTDNKKLLERVITGWLKKKYRYQQLISFVQLIKRQIIIEKLLTNEKKEIPKDYKFFIFDGKLEFIQVDQDRFSSHAQNYYDKDWKRTNFTWRCKIGKLDEKPVLLDKMIELAEILASDFTFMRVDFYNIGKEIYFGELTPCPGGGTAAFNPVEYDNFYGEKWKNHINLMRQG